MTWFDLNRDIVVFRLGSVLVDDLVGVEELEKVPRHRFDMLYVSGETTHTSRFVRDTKLDIECSALFPDLSALRELIHELLAAGERSSLLDQFPNRGRFWRTVQLLFLLEDHFYDRAYGNGAVDDRLIAHRFASLLFVRLEAMEDTIDESEGPDMTEVRGFCRNQDERAALKFGILDHIGDYSPIDLVEVASSESDRLANKVFLADVDVHMILGN